MLSLLWFIFCSPVRINSCVLWTRIYFRVQHQLHTVLGTYTSAAKMSLIAENITDQASHCHLYMDNMQFNGFCRLELQDTIFVCISIVHVLKQTAAEDSRFCAPLLVDDFISCRSYCTVMLCQLQQFMTSESTWMLTYPWWHTYQRLPALLCYVSSKAFVDQFQILFFSHWSCCGWTMAVPYCLAFHHTCFSG